MWWFTDFVDFVFIEGFVYRDVAVPCSILIPLASSQQNLYDIYLLLCIQY